jgi:hypothetical protein
MLNVVGEETPVTACSAPPATFAVSRVNPVPAVEAPSDVVPVHPISMGSGEKNVVDEAEDVALDPVPVADR